jgi:hypothetical protein
MGTEDRSYSAAPIHVNLLPRHGELAKAHVE